MTQKNEIKNNSDALLNFLIGRAASGEKNWFGFLEQRIAGVDLVYRIAVNHADKMKPAEVVEYVLQLNDEIYQKMLRAR